MQQEELQFEELEELHLEVGDAVAFECADFDNSGPRWHFNDDLGESGIWAQGTVVYVDNEIIQTEFFIEGYIGKGKCTWPNYDHIDYDPMQWWQEGYLMLIEKPKCECGGERAKTTHSDWCPKYD